MWLIECATGGTDLYDDWDPTATTLGQLCYYKAKRFFDEQVANLDAGVFKFGGTIWIQGERDAQDASGGPNYETNLTALKAAIDSDFGDGPMVCARLSSAAVAWTYKSDVNDAIDAVAAADADVYAINTDALSFQADNTHYETDSYVTLGNAMATQLLTHWGY